MISRKPLLKPSNYNAAAPTRMQASITYDIFTEECEKSSQWRKTKTLYDQHRPWSSVSARSTPPPSKFCASSSKSKKTSTCDNTEKIPRRLRQSLAPLLLKVYLAGISKTMLRLVTLPEDVQGKGRRTAVLSQDRHGRSTAMLSTLTPPVQHLF
ncbi:hypothetical protein Trydic_g7214 [Trypoxylus dichotomus]